MNCRLVARIARAGPSVPSGGFGDRSGEDTAGGGGEAGNTALEEGRTDRGQGETRMVYFGPECGWLDTPIIARDDLDATARPGPSIVEEYDSTVVVPPGWNMHRDECGNIVLRVGAG